MFPARRRDRLLRKYCNDSRLPQFNAIFLAWVVRFLVQYACRRSKKVLGGRKRVMTAFYYEIWVPFVMTKRRILVLAIASYLALC